MLFVLTWIFLFSGLYTMYPWLDIPMHFFGGASVAVTYFLILRFLQEKHQLVLPGSARIMFVWGLVALTAILWELFEYSTTIITGLGLQGDLPDTMFDQFLGLVGGILMAFVLEMIYSNRYFKSK